MKIEVIGGAGLIGSKAVERPRGDGHEAVAASPESGVSTLTWETTGEIPIAPPQPAVVAAAPIEPAALKDNEFRVTEVSAGSALLVGTVAVFNVAGQFCATQAKCTHRQGPLSEGTLDGSTVTCPYHGAQFNVCTGAVLRGPARDPLKTYQVTVDGGIGRIEAGAPAASEKE